MRFTQIYAAVALSSVAIAAASSSDRVLALVGAAYPADTSVDPATHISEVHAKSRAALRRQLLKEWTFAADGSAAP